MEIDKLKKIVIDAVEELKATDITVLDVRQLTTFTDYMIICTGRSSRHVVSIAHNVVEQAKSHKQRPLGVAGEETGDWVLVDLGDIIVHVMQPTTRSIYELEKLWSA